MKARGPFRDVAFSSPLVLRAATSWEMDPCTYFRACNDLRVVLLTPAERIFAAGAFKSRGLCLLRRSRAG